MIQPFFRRVARAPRSTLPMVVASIMLSVPLAVSACGSSRSAGSGSDHKLQSVSLAMTNLSITYLPERIAIVEGFWKKQGLDVKVSQLTSTTAIPAVAAGKIDFGDSTGSTLEAAAQGIPVRLVACGGIRPLYNLIAQPSIKSLSQLKGKTVGTNALGVEQSYVASEQAVQAKSVSPKTITWVGLGASSSRASALESDRVAAVVISPPESQELIAKGYTSLLSPKDYLPQCNEGIMTSVSKLKSDPGEVKKMLIGYHEALQFMFSNKAASIDILANWLGVDKSIAEEAYDSSVTPETFSVDGQISNQNLFSVVKEAIAAGTVKGPVSLSDVRNFSIWDQVIKGA